MAKKKQTRKKVSEAKTAKKTKVSQRNRVRNLSGSDWRNYERVWAENGVVNIEDKTGRISRLDPLTAKRRAQAVHDMTKNDKMDWATKEHMVNFVARVLPVIQEAVAQVEEPSTTKEKLVSNVLHGKTAEGKEIKPITDPEEMLKFMGFKYPMLSADEIRNVCTEQIPHDEKIGILRTINSDRMMAMVQENERIKAEQ